MDELVQNQKQNYKSWVTENLGEKTGMWYSPYLEKLGSLLNQFELATGYKDNFFDYQSYEEFKEVYQQMTEQTDNDIERIVKGKVPRYPKDFGAKRIQFRQKFAEDEFERGVRSKPTNLGGIPDWGVLLRSYLIYLYYNENPNLSYPKKKKADIDGIDDSINYWLISPGEQARLWESFHSENVIAIGWDYLGDLKEYESKERVAAVLTQHRDNGKHPTHDTRAVWDFYHEMQVGDLVYVKAGMNRIVASGVIVGEYQFDEGKNEYKHRRDVDWKQVGQWNLRHNMPQKTVTNINRYPDLIQEIEQVLDDTVVDPKTTEVNEFRNWLTNQVTDTGMSLNEKTITQKINALQDIESYFETTIFGEEDTDQLKQLRDVVIANESYQRYKGVSGSAIDYYIRYIESKPTILENDPYSTEEFLSEVFINDEELKRTISVLENKKNLIMKGAPGVGKTFIAKRLAYVMMEEKDESRVNMVQFHQSYSYEDFIEGFRPKADGDGFELKQGPFVKFARKAARDPERDYFFIIDEINRGNMSKIFGELMMLIETDKRGEQVNLLYSNEKFSVPPNLYIIGMMNTADRSLALLDYALRRRFSFIEMKPAFENETFQSYVNELDDPMGLLRVIGEVKLLNQQIVSELGIGFQIGHSYFVGDAYKVNPLSRVEEVIEFEIIPQLLEYWFDDEQKANDWAKRLRDSIHGAE
ncbi:AAA family ATPase [Alkalihalobacillus sp. FSL W8-0930]